MNSNSKSILAKLLAKENITVNHGNYSTAFFDPDQRVLGLPLWKEMDKHTYDLMIGHEIGHALETPCDGWHNAEFDIPGCPRAFVNVVEDIRIEKLVQRRYPGLVRSFKLGYFELMKKDFFDIGNKDVNTMSFMNRLNLKSKLRDLIDVSFSAEEQPYVDMAMSVETWDDVIKACRAIYEYLKEKQENEKKKQQLRRETRNGEGNNKESFKQSQQSGSEEEGESIEQDLDDASDEGPSLDGDSNDEDQVSLHNVEDRKDDQEDEQEVKTGATSGSNYQEQEQDALDVSTDDAYRKNEESLLEKDSLGGAPKVVNAMTRAQIKEVIIPYADIAKDRAEMREFYGEAFKHSVDEAKYNNEFKKFMDETTKIVGVMVKEFETRKAAYQYSRSKTSRSGTLNVSKLHEYKFSDDIFRKVTKLADAKSHGMIMLIDRSGSMRYTIADVIRQTLTLAMFCKKVNIPFDVYSYTKFPKIALLRNSTYQHRAGDICHLPIAMCQVLSSSLKRSEYDEAFRGLFNQSVGTALDQQYFWGKCEVMGSTPSCEVMSAMPTIVSDFKAKHGVQKVIVPVLTDGEPSMIAYHRLYNGGIIPSELTGKMIMNVNGTYLRAAREVDMFTKLGDYLRSMGVITVGYFLTESYVSAKYMIGRASNSWEKETFKKANKQQRENKFVSFDNTLGYDRYFIVRTSGNGLSTDIDELEIKEGARVGEITKAFKKYANSKKTNRIFATQFAEIVS